MALPCLVSAQEEEPPAETESSEAATFSSVIFIEAPVLYTAGVDPVLQPLIPPPDPEADPGFATRAASIVDYGDRVEEIESSGGAWDSGLIESLAALGSLQQAQGDHLSAIQSFDRALHVNRINDGLHTPAQITLIEQMLESYLAIDDWVSADLYHDYLFYIQQKAYGSADPRMISVLARHGGWNLDAFRRGIGDPLGLRLSTAIILYNAAARLRSEHFGRNDEQFIAYQKNIAQVAFLIGANAELMGEIDRSQIRAQQDELREMLNEDTPIMPSGFAAGEAALLEIIAVEMEAADNLRLAEAYAQLGDWYLMAERRRRAAQQYAVAWNLLADPDETEAPETEAPETETPEAEQQVSEQQLRFFSEIKIIPAFAQQGRYVTRVGVERPALNTLQSGEVDLSFTVSRNGQVRDVEILSEETEENAGHLATVRREIRRYRFRPRIESGELIESQNNRARVRFWY